jgi:hypothetical protein
MKTRNKIVINNLVAKHMRTFNHGGAHKNKKDLMMGDEDDYEDQLSLAEYRELTDVDGDLGEDYVLLYHLYGVKNMLTNVNRYSTIRFT